MNDTLTHIRKTRDAQTALALSNTEKRDQVLRALAEELVKSADLILQENAKDLAAMPEGDPRHDRLLLDKKRLQGIAEDTARVAGLPSPLGKTLEERTLPNGLRLRRVSVPLGVVGVIYESRPNVTVDVFALCFKAGNACVLKGGKEAHHSNAVLAGVIRSVLARYGLDPELLCLLPSDRAATQALLEAKGLVDVCIPRGSQALIDFVRDNAKVPVIETGAGIVHTYFDLSGDLSKGKAIVFNAKTRRVSVCNALDTLLVHEKRRGDLPSLIEPLAEKNVEIFADEDAYEQLADAYPAPLLHRAQPEDFGREFLCHKMSVKTVASLDEALAHIRKYTSHHSEAIIAEDQAAIGRFMNEVDAAAVYANTSTAFTDGAQFGLGAEIGISTQKLHARGPMGLEALTSYKWLVYGDGQVRG